MKFKDYEKKEKDNNGMTSEFMRLKDGKNTIRIVSEFESYPNHYIPTEKRSHICTVKNCKYCDGGDKPKIRFLFRVIDRDQPVIDGVVSTKLLDVGYSVFEQVVNLAKTEDYGFTEFPEYDIVIEKSGIGLSTEYNVIPKRDLTPLTDEEQMAVNNADPIVDILTARREKQLNEYEQSSDDDSINIKDIPF